MNREHHALNIRPVQVGDREAWVEMRLALWPDGQRHEFDAEARDYFAGDHRFLERVLVAERGGAVIGMIELSLRSIADGCISSPVPYIEGWFVAAEARRQGVGGALVRAAEGWARAQGHNEIASDALLENQVSENAHKALGFDVVCRSILFRKALA
jgi:aminoglycoside 6'-N-acetyltransferase I